MEKYRVLRGELPRRERRRTLTPHFPYFELLTLGRSCACHDYCC